MLFQNFRLPERSWIAGALARKISFCLLAFMSFGLVQAEPLNCLSAGPVFLPPGGGGGGGGGTYPLWDCTDFMDFLPDATTPVKVVRVNFQIMQKSDGSANFQQGNAQHDAWLQGIQDYLENDAFIVNPPPVWPQTGVNDLSSAYIKFKVEGIYYHQSDAGWDFGNVFNNSSTPQTFSVKAHQEINIFFTGGTGGLGGMAGGWPGPVFSGIGFSTTPNYRRAYVAEKNAWQSLVNGSSIPRVAHEIGHELGHCLGLYHTHSCAGPIDSFSDTPVDGCCCPTPVNGSASNNVMSYNVGNIANDPGSVQRYLSPMQIAEMHANLTKNPWAHQYLSSETCVYDPGATITVTGNEVWTKNRNLSGDVVVKPGAKLTIRECAMISFPEEGRLIVERGGWLIIDGGTLTNLCNGMWKGVELWGDPNKNQVYAQPFNQARLEMRNGAVIEYARDGVTTSRKDPNTGNFVWSHTGGGVIEAENSYFRNNRRAVEFMKYHNRSAGKEFDNLSYFKNCVFENWGFLRDPSYQVSGKPIANLAMVSMWEVNGIDFEGCTFRNHTPLWFPGNGLFGPNYLKGTGIHSVDASYDVKKGTGMGVWDNTFWGLSKGVDVQSNGAAGTIYVDDMDFVGVSHAVGIYGGAGHDIRNNTIDYYTSASSYFDPLTPFIYAATFADCNGFLFYKNSLRLQNFQLVPGLPIAFGIISNNSGNNKSLIYDNWGFDPDAFMQTENDNQSLIYACNRMYGPPNSLVLNPNSTNGLLPNLMGCGAGLDGMGNEFNTTCVSPFPKSHIYKSYNPWAVFEYRKFATGSEPDPACSSADVLISDCGGSTTENECDAVFDPPKEPVFKAALKAANEGIIAQKAFLDGGNTQGLVDLIADPDESASSINATLNENQPLSDAVLIAWTENSTIPNSLVTGQLMVNGPLSRDVVDAVLARDPAFAASELTTLMANQSNFSSDAYKVKSKIASLEAEKMSIISDLITSYRNDGSGLGETSIKELLEGESSLATDKMLIPLYIRDGQYSEAASRLEQLAGVDALEDWRNLQNLLIELGLAHKNVFQMDVSQRATLDLVAASAHPVKYHAKGLIKLIDGVDFDYEPELIAPASKYAGAESPVETAAIADLQITALYPNPTNAFATVEFDLPEAASTVNVLLYNATGQLVRRFEVREEQGGQLRFDLSGLVSGMYFLSVQAGEKVSQTQRLILNR